MGLFYFSYKIGKKQINYFKFIHAVEKIKSKNHK